MTHLNLNALRMFDAAARHENFKRAAQEINVTQGAVAQQIRGLEARLGKPLFQRHARGLKLTSEGAAYHAEIQNALQIIHDATSRLQRKSEITLSVTPSLASKWLLPKLPNLIENNENIDLKIHASDQKSDLLRGDADLAIRQGPPPNDPQITTLPLAPVCYVAVMSPRPTRPPMSLEEVLHERLIQDGHFHWDRLCSDLGHPMPKATLNFNQTALALDAAASGQGVALAPLLLAQEAIASHSLQAVWIDPRATDHGFHVLYRTKNPRPETILVANWLANQTTIPDDPSDILAIKGPSG